MRSLQLFTAGFLLASAMFVATMLASPPTSRAATVTGAPATLELVGP